MGMQMPDETTDQRQGEVSQSFWDLFVPHRQSLYAFIKKSLNYSEDADDIFQESVIRALRYFSGYHADHPFRSWLYSIAHNELKKQYKSLSSMSMALPEDICLKDVVNETDPLLIEEVRRLHELAMELKNAWREVFFLYYQDGFNVEEIAMMTNRSGGHVKFILNRIRKAVKVRLGEKP